MSLLPVIDDFSPYSQIVNQVSIIDTINGQIIPNTQEDIVYDPKSISIFDLISILKNLYDRQGDKYVVYNKSFENTRNMEIASWTQSHSSDEIFAEELYNKLAIKPDDVMNFANYINNRTIDLYELFSRPSKKRILMTEKSIKIYILQLMKLNLIVKLLASIVQVWSLAKRTIL